MKMVTKRVSHSLREAMHQYMNHRQAANYERFLQERAGVFQVTDGKEQAMFWAQGLLTR